MCQEHVCVFYLFIFYRGSHPARAAGFLAQVDYREFASALATGQRKGSSQMGPAQVSHPRHKLREAGGKPQYGCPFDLVLTVFRKM